MQGRVFALMTLGFASLFLIGAAGAASDTYFEVSAKPDTHDIQCNMERMAEERPDLDRPRCSVHRVSPTFGRQKMAMNLTVSSEIDD